MKDLPSGSYELQLLGKLKSQPIKKHGSDISLCPKEINPSKTLDTSDKEFYDINKKIVSSPYQHAGILDYTPAIPYAAPAAVTKVINSEKLTSVPKFPSVKELDDISN